MSEGVSCFKNLYLSIVRMQHASSQGTVCGGIYMYAWLYVLLVILLKSVCKKLSASNQLCRFRIVYINLI